ncbi:hypothetical protein [Actinoalloteichus spitiensis]|uniref:hypothetical protein n=1 Tax=Actinoalloteichus spitiensis TaxID=252394 RepID=UPI0012F65AED|nr:hypothetical protein [Actinoalloteichus spitiensis]
MTGAPKAPGVGGAGRTLPSRTRRVGMLPAAFGLGAALLLTGCSAGQITQTSSQVPVIAGADADAGTIAVRDAKLTFPTEQDPPAYPAGSDAPVSVTIVNRGTDADTLLSVTSPSAESVTVEGDTTLPAGTKLVATGLGAESELAVPGAGEPEAGELTQPAPETDAAQSGQDAADIGVFSLTLVGLHNEVHPGVNVELVFEFENAGPLSLQVPVGEDPEPAVRGD